MEARINGNTAAMVDAFVDGAKDNGHNITVVPVCRKKIAGCLACEYCHTKQLAAVYVQREIPNVKVTSSEATYLLWLDCTKMVGFASEAAGFIREKTGLYLSEGGQFGGNGEHFLRMNIACPRPVLQDGLGRLKEGLAAYEEYTLNLC